MIIDCNRIWTQLVALVYRVRRKPMVTNRPPALPNRAQR